MSCYYILVLRFLTRLVVSYTNSQNFNIWTGFEFSFILSLSSLPISFFIQPFVDIDADRSAGEYILFPPHSHSGVPFIPGQLIDNSLLWWSSELVLQSSALLWAFPPLVDVNWLSKFLQSRKRGLKMKRIRINWVVSRTLTNIWGGEKRLSRNKS